MNSGAKTQPLRWHLDKQRLTCDSVQDNHDEGGRMCYEREREEEREMERERGGESERPLSPYALVESEKQREFFVAFRMNLS